MNDTESAGAGPDIEVLRGSPSPTELAAVIAVVESLAAESSDAAPLPVSTSAWQRSQRSLRTPLHSIGAWRSFSG